MAKIEPKVKAGAAWGYVFNAGLIAFIGVVEDGRLCSALPDWASALLIPLLPVGGAMVIAYRTRHQWRTGDLSPEDRMDKHLARRLDDEGRHSKDDEGRHSL